MKTYKFHSTASAFNNQIGHIANQVSSKAKVEEHIENDEDHLKGVNCMEVTIANSGHGGDRPVNGRNVTHPKAGFSEVWVHCAYPCLPFVWVPIC